MASNKKRNREREEIDDDDEEESDVEGREVNLDRTYTYEGEHYGPGLVTIQAKDQERTDLIADSLESRQKKLQRAERRRGESVRRADKSTTGVIHEGTDQKFDQKAPDTEDFDEDESDAPSTRVKKSKKKKSEGSTKSKLYKFGDEQLPASALWDKDDDELKEGGLSQKKIDKIRRAHQRSQAGGGGQSEEQEEAAD